MSDHADIVKRALSWCEEGEMGNRHREAGLAALDALVADNRDWRRLVDDETARAEAAEAERDKANVEWHRMRDLHGWAIKDLREREAEVARLLHGVSAQAEEARTLREALTIVPLDEWKELADGDIMDLIDVDTMQAFLSAARAAAPSTTGGDS